MKKLYMRIMLMFISLFFVNLVISENICKAAQSVTMNEITISHKQYVLKKGQSVKLKIAQSSKKVKVSKIVWNSSNPQKVKVNRKGVVTARAKKGNATITAKVGKKNLKCKITIGIPVKKLQVSDMTLKKGDEKQLEVKVLPENAIIKNLKYVSSNNNVVFVDKKGKLVAKEAGKVTISIWAVDRMKVSQKMDIVVEEKDVNEVVPTIAPSIAPTEVPSINPTIVPSVKPTDAPSAKPTAEASKKPTAAPSIEPTEAPTETPTVTLTPVPVEKGGLTGIVKAKQGSTNTSVLADAKVSIYSESTLMFETKTSAEGVFRIDDLDCSKKYILVVEKDGFQNKEIENISVEKNVTTSVTETGIITLLSQSVALISVNSNNVIVNENTIMAPEDMALADILSELQNPEGGTITTVGEDQIQVMAEDGTTTKDYSLELVQRETALIENEDFVIDYELETLQISQNFDYELEYRYSGETTWTRLSKTEDTNIFEILDLESAIEAGTTLYIRKVKSQDMLFDAFATEIPLCRPEFTSIKYYKITSQNGLRYGVEKGVVNQKYDMYLSNTLIDEWSEIASDDIIQLIYTGIDTAETFYECESNYSYVYVRLASTDTTFASSWIKAEYQTRDNEFDADDIP